MSSTLVHWVQHAREADVASDKCYSTGLDSGEFQFAGYILTYKLTNFIFQGKNLSTLKETSGKYLDFIEKTKNCWALDMILGTQMVLANLLGLTDETAQFSHGGLSEQDFYQRCRTINNFSALCRYHIFKALALYVMGEYHQARKAIREAGKNLPFLFGTIYSAEYVFIDSLTLTGLLDGSENDKKNEYIALIRANQEQMKIWANSCKENFYHRYLLIEAEMERVADNPLMAMEFYDQAIDLAGKSGFVQNEAIANELAGRFWLKRNKPEFAALYLQKNYYCFEQWGASRKLRQLDSAYPVLHDTLSEGKKVSADKAQSHETINMDTLDVDTLSGEQKCYAGLYPKTAKDSFAAGSTGCHLS